jgi:myosin-3
MSSCYSFFFSLVFLCCHRRPHFIRCIKPNTGQAPYKFEDPFVMLQLQYTGMLETVRIRHEGYAVRPPFREFTQRCVLVAVYCAMGRYVAEPRCVFRFRVIALSFTGEMAPTPANCRLILEHAKIKDYLMGKTKVFLRYKNLGELEIHVMKLHAGASKVQALEARLTKLVAEDDRRVEVRW